MNECYVCGSTHGCVVDKLRSGCSVTPDELAMATTRQCFLEADTNKDGQLSFEEFKVCYRKDLSQLLY